MLRKPIASVCLVLALGAMGGAAVFESIHAQTSPAPNPAVLVAPRESYRDIVKKVLPAVVSIEVKGKALAQQNFERPRQNSFDEQDLPKDLRKFFDDFQKQPGHAWKFSPETPNMPPEPPHHGFGSGFVIDSHGIIVTNNHVVKDADQVIVLLHDGRKFVSHDVKTDPKSDLAIVRIKTKDLLPCLEWGNSDAMEIGDRVLAVGSPFGLRGTVTSGIISGKGRSLGLSAYEDFLQTDAAINPGNSGGPLVNLEGKVIGIDTAIKTQSGGSQGIGLAIASDAARKIVDQLIHQGVVHRGYLGVQIRELAPDVAARLHVPNNTGVVVAKVVDNSPAAKAGIKAGDVITTVGSTAVTEPRALQRLIAGEPIGKALNVTVYRDGAEKRLSVTLQEQPASLTAESNPAPTAPKAAPSGMRLDKLGMELQDMTPAMAQQFGFHEKQGAVLSKVDAGSLAAEAGLERGSLILKVDNSPVQSAAEAKTAIERGSLAKGVLLQVKTPRQDVGYVMLQEAGAR